jgi:hypothetical protein
MPVRDEKCIKNLFGNPIKNRPLAIPRSKWEDNITMVLGKQGGKVRAGYL